MVAFLLCDYLVVIIGGKALVAWNSFSSLEEDLHCNGVEIRAC